MVNEFEKGQFSVLFYQTVTVQRRLFLTKFLQNVVEVKKWSKYKMCFNVSSNNSVSSFATRSPSASFELLFLEKLEKQKIIFRKR